MTFFYNKLIYVNKHFNCTDVRYIAELHRTVSCTLLFDVKFNLTLKRSSYFVCFCSKMCSCNLVCKNSQIPTPRKRNEGEMNLNHAL